MAQPVDLSQIHTLPRWRRPEALLILMSAAMPIAFSVWLALLNNFAVERAAFDGSDMGWLQTIREIPGFLAFAVVYLLLVIREQTLAYLSLLLLGAAVAVTGLLPSFWGLALTTIIGSIGFHYFETVNQSLQLQWLDKQRAPVMLGWLRSVNSGVSLVIYALLAVFGVAAGGALYTGAYLIAGSLCVAVVLAAMIAFPRFEGGTVQTKKIILRRRYWLYYALTFMGGARRQIFIVFAAFMLVDKFGFAVHETAGLLLLNHAATMTVAPFIGRLIAQYGERAALTLEYIGLIGVFAAYAMVADPRWAAALYILDHMLFAIAFAQKTYFQKIADPADIAPTSAVAFTINHIAAVFLPASLGYLYIVSPGAVFWIGVAMACVSLGLARLVPRHPSPGNETILGPVAPATAG